MPVIFNPSAAIKTMQNTSALLGQSSKQPMSLGAEIYKNALKATPQQTEKQAAKADNDVYAKITNPLEISLLEVSKKIRMIKSMFKKNPQDAIKEFKGYLHKLIDQTGIEISNEHVVSRATPEELLLFNVAPRGRVEEFSKYIKAKNGECKTVFFLNNNDKVLAQGLISPNNKVESIYNALSPDGSSIACDLYTRGGTDYGSIMLYNKNNKLNCSLNLDGGTITYRKAR